jgi:hypothetical protein
MEHQCTNPRKADRSAPFYMYECDLCYSWDKEHWCKGCRLCGSYDPTHDCHLSSISIKNQNYHPLRDEIAEKHTLNQTIRDALDEDCGKPNWMMCNNIYYQEHVFDKLEDWHDQQAEHQLFKGECTKEHFLDCEDLRCPKHVMIRHRFRLLTKALNKKGYNTITHTHKGQGAKSLIKEFHSMIEDRIYDTKCKWCYKYQGKTWRESHLGRITIDSIGQSSKKLFIKGYLKQQPITIYVDCGADRNLITPELINRLGLTKIAKPIPSYASSIVHPDHHVTIKYETDHLPLTVAERTTKVKFDMMKMDKCDIMLGY